MCFLLVGKFRRRRKQSIEPKKLEISVELKEKIAEFIKLSGA